jgi:hypothetical protein
MTSLYSPSAESPTHKRKHEDWLKHMVIVRLLLETITQRKPNLTLEILIGIKLPPVDGWSSVGPPGVK